MYKFISYRFEVITWDIADLQSQLLPDSLENTIRARESATVWITNKPLRHGDQFTAIGKEATRLKTQFVDVEKPLLKIVG